MWLSGMGVWRQKCVLLMLQSVSYSINKGLVNAVVALEATGGDYFLSKAGMPNMTTMLNVQGVSENTDTFVFGF